MTGWTMDVELAGLGPGPPWSYAGRASELLPGARTVLDMGTGGGERFLGLLDGYGGLAIATEGWSGNIHVASEALARSGVHVAQSSGLHLPFHDACFDLVLNRHDELTPLMSPGFSRQAAPS